MLCGREQLLNVNPELLVDRGQSGAGTDRSIMATDSAEGAGSATYWLARSGKPRQGQFSPRVRER